jgi:glycosyltransferase involved in cell wall biosynthesis
MRVVALMTVRNEELYLERCIQHLVNQGVEVCLIDNGSTDKTRDIASAYLGRGVMRLEEIPFNGKFELEKILQNEERLAYEIDADWFMHHDADEIREAPTEYRGLLDGIADADRHGYNAINFDEFVFLPTGEDEDHRFSDYVSTMKYYYFFEAAPLRRLNLWKNMGQTIDLTSSGGHHVKFQDRNIFPKPFIMRHYVFLSRAHADRKYSTRQFSDNELAKGWHRAREKYSKKAPRLPDKTEMKSVTDGLWDKSDAKYWNLFFTPKPTPAERAKFCLYRLWRTFGMSRLTASL